MIVLRLFIPIFSFICLLFSATAWGAFKLEIRTIGKGTVNGAGSYVENSFISISATPAPGYEFKGWSGELAGKGNPLSLQISSNIKANAHFEPIETNIVYLDGMPALGGSFVAKLNDTGRRLLRRRVNRVGGTKVYRRNKVLSDFVTIEWDAELRLQDNLNAQNLSSQALQQLSQKKSALKSQGIEKQIKDMINSGNYEYVEPNWLLKTIAEPNDQAFTDGRLWGLKNTGQNGGVRGVDANVVNAWDVSTGSSEVVVAVIDSGVRYTHNDLSANMWKNPGEIANNGIDDDGNGFVDDVFGINAITGANNNGNPNDDNGHGTHVAGTIGAVANAGGPAVGVAWNVRIMALKFLGSRGGGYLNDAITCIDYAIANGARVINASYGGGGYSQAGFDVIKRANQAGIIFVAAAGNDEKDNDWRNTYPSGYEVENIISVAAIDRSGRLANFSNYGRTQVDLGAPGVAIFSTWANSDSSYLSISGTSMASPHVAGAAAILVSTEPRITPAEARQRLIDHSAPLSSLSGKVVSNGMLDLNAALRVTPPQQLRMQVTHFPQRPARRENMEIRARITAGQPVVRATVSASIANQLTLTLRDDGIAPDQSANDGIYSGSTTTPDRASLELVVSASHGNFLPVSQTIPVETVNRPPHDSFSRATLLSQTTDSTPGDNSEATLENLEPLFSNTVTGTVWYSWRPSLDGQATLDTHGSSIDTTLAVFTGNSLSTLKLIASNDDATDRQLTSSVSFSARATEKYWVQIGGYVGEAGKFILNHPTPVPPDAPAPPPGEVLPPVITTPVADLSKAEGESLGLEVAVEGTAPFEYQWILNGGVIDGAVGATYTLPRLSIEDSGEYSVLVRNRAGFVVELIANLTVRESKEVPTNDDADNAEILFGESGSVSAVTRRATGQFGEPQHAGVPPPRHSVWWKWTAPRDGTLQVDTLGSSFDTLLAAYRWTDDNSTANRRSSPHVPSSTLLFTPPTENQPAHLLWPEHGLQDGNRIRLTGLFNHPAAQSVFSISVLGPDEISLSGTTGLSNLRLSASGEAHKQSQAQPE